MQRYAVVYETMTQPAHTSEDGKWLAVRRLVRSARANGALDGMDGKRKSQRFRFCASLEFTSDPTRSARTTAAKMHNVSEGGLSFWSKKRLPPNRQVFVRSLVDGNPTEWVPAVVCHSTRGIMGFLIGVEFQLEPAE